MYYTNMNTKVQISWSEARNIANSLIKESRIKPKELSILCGIDYFAARRFIRNGITNETNAAKKICKHFKIEFSETAKINKVQKLTIDDLNSTLADVWDGTESHATFLINMIKLTKSFTIKQGHKHYDEVSS